MSVSGPFVVRLASLSDSRSDPPSRAFASPAPRGPFETLRSLSLFQGASEPDLHRLAGAATFRSFARGRSIPGGDSGAWTVLVSGRARTVITRGPSSSELAIGLFDEGEILGDGGYGARGEDFLGETVALETSAVLFLPHRALEAFLHGNPEVAVRFVVAIAARLHRVTRTMVENACLDIGDRLCRRLSELASSRGRTQPDGSLRIDHGLLQSELAASIGTSREAVNRQFAAWKQQGLIEAGRRYVVVRDPVGLSMAVSRTGRGGLFSSVGRRA